MVIQSFRSMDGMAQVALDKAVKNSVGFLGAVWIWAHFVVVSAQHTNTFLHQLLIHSLLIYTNCMVKYSQLPQLVISQFAGWRFHHASVDYFVQGNSDGFQPQIISSPERLELLLVPTIVVTLFVPKHSSSYKRNMCQQYINPILYSHRFTYVRSTTNHLFHSSTCSYITN